MHWATLSAKRFARYSPFSSILLAALMLVGAGCDDGPTSVQSSVSVQTDQDHYNVGESITLRLENRGNNPVPFHHCDYRLTFFVDKRVDQRWQDDFGVAATCIGILPTGEYGLQPGAVYRDSIRIGIPGVYRVTFWVFDDAGQPVRSNTFEVR